MLKILITEDDDVQISLLQDILSETPHQAAYFNRAQLALDHFSEHPTAYDLVITDILMPDMDGLEFIRSIRKISPKILVIAASAGGQLDSDFYLKLARDFGAAMILEKPLTKHKLLAALEEVRHL
jgi:CheY-like chemotaxis protein